MDVSEGMARMMEDATSVVENLHNTSTKIIIVNKYSVNNIFEVSSPLMSTSLCSYT